MAENLQGCELSAYSLAMSIVTQNKDLTEALIRYSNETNVQQLYADALREGAAQGVEGGIKKNASKATLKSQSADVKFKSILYGSVLANTTQGDDALRQLMKAMEDSGENIAVGNRLIEMMKDLDISEINAIAKALGTNADEAELAIKGFKEKVAYYNGTNYSFITNGDMVKAKKATKDKEKEINKARDVLKRAEEKANSVGKDVKKMVDDDLSRLDKEAEEYANEKIKGIILTENQRQEKIAMYKKTYFNTTKGKATLNELQNKYGIKGGTYLKVKQGIEEIKNADNVIKDTKSRISILEKEYREMLNADLESIKHGQNPYNYIETGDTWRFTKSFDAEPSQRMADYGHYMLARTLLSDTSGDLPDSVYKIIEDTVKQQTNKGLENYMGVELTDEWILDSNRTLEELMSRAYMNTKDLIENGQLRTLYRQRLIELATDGRLINDDINFVESLIKTAKFAEAGEGFSSILLDNMLARTAQGMGIDIKNVDGKQIRNGILKVFGAQDFNKQITSGKPIHIFGNINVDSRQLLELSASMVGDLNVYKVIAKDNWDDNTLLQVVGSYLSGGKSGGDKRFIKLLTTVKETPTTDDTLGVILKATTGFDVPKGTEIAFYDFRKKYHTTEETSARAKFMDRLTEGNSITISDTITDITKNEIALLDELKKKKWDKGGFIIVNGSDWKQDDVLYQTLKVINEGRSDEKKIQVIFPKGKGAESFSLNNGKLVYKTTSPKAMDAFLQKTAIRTMGSTLSDSRITEDIMEKLAKGDIEAVAEYNKLLEEDAKNYFAQMLGTTADDENLIPLIEQKTGILFKNYDALKNKQEFWKLVDSKFTLAERVTGRYSSVVEKVEDIVLRGKTITAEEMSKDLTHEYGFDISPEILKKGDDIPENIRNAYTNLQLSENVGEYLENKGRLLAVINGSDGGVIPMSNFKDMFASGDYSTYKQLFFGNVDMTDEELAKYVNQINDMIFDGLTQQVANNLIDMGFELPGGINLKEAVYNQLKGKLGANSPFAQAFLYKNGLQDSTVTVQSILDDALPESLNFNFDKLIEVKTPTRKTKVRGYRSRYEEPKDLNKKLKKSKIKDESGNPIMVYRGGAITVDDVFQGKNEYNRFGKNVAFFTSDMGEARGYGFSWEYGTRIEQGYLNIERPYIFNAKGANWGDLSVDKKTREAYVKMWNDKYDKFKKKRIKHPDYKLEEHIDDINKELQYFGYKLKPASDGYGGIDVVGIGPKNFDTKMYSIDTVDELFNYWDADGYIRFDADEVEDWGFSTEHLVRYVLYKNELGAKYDGIVITNVQDSTRMLAPSIDDYIIFNNKQFNKVNLVEEAIETEEQLPVGYINRIVKEDNQFLPSNSYSALTSMAIADKGTTLPFIGNEKAILEGILNKYKTSLEQATQGKAISFAEAQKLKLQASYALDMFEQDYLASKYRRFLTPKEQGELFGLKYNLGVATRNTDLAQIEQMNKAIIDRYNNATKRIINTNNDIIKGFVKGDKGIRAELEARQKELLQQGATLKEVNGTIVVVDSRDEIMRGINSLPNTILGLDIIKNIGRAGLEQLTNEQAYFLMNLIDLSKVMENKNNLIQQTIYRLKPQLAKIDFFNRFAVEDGIPMALSGLLLGGKYFSKYDNLNVFDDAVKRNIFSQIKDEFSKNGRLTKNKEKRWFKGKGNEAYEVLEGIIDNAISANMHQLKGNITDIKTFKANAKKAYMDAFNPYTILEDVPQGVKDNIDNILKEQQEGLRGAMSLLGSDDELTSIIDNIYIRQYNGDVISMRNALDGGTPDMNKVLFDTDSNYIIAADEAAGKKINPEWSETKKRNVEKENRDTARVVENSYLEGLNSYLNNSEFISAREKELRDRVGITARQAVEKYSTTRKFSEFDNAVTGLNDEIVRDIKSEILGFFGDITEGGNNWLSRGKIKTNIQEDIMFRWEKFKDKYSSIYSLSPEQLSVYKPKDKLDKAALNMVVYFKEMEKRLGSVNGMTGVSLDATINKAFNHIGEVVTNIRDVRGVMSLMSGIEGNQAFKFFQFSNSNDASFVAKLRYKGETDDWGKLAGYRKYVDKNDLGMDLVTFNNTFGTNFDDSEYKLVMQGLTGATMIDKGWRWLHDIISVVNGSNYFSRALLSYPGQLFTVANQSIGYFLKQIGFEKSLGMENIYDIDRVRKESGILNGAYNEINWFRKYANYDSDDVLNSFNRYGIPDVEDAYKKMDIYTTDDVESIYGKFDEYFSRDEGNWFYRWVNKVSRNTDAYKDNANNIIDGVFARNFKNIAFEKALGDNRVMKFATAQQFEEFMKSDAPKSLKDAVMNAIQESSGRNFKNMLGIGFSGLDKTLSGVSNNMLGLMNMFNFRGAWGRNIFRQTNDFIQGAMHMARTGLDEEGITAITSYIARQPEFVNFTTQMFNDIVASWKLVRYQDNGKRNEIDNEYNLMDFLEYMSDNMKFVSQTMQGLSSYGLSRIVGDVFESTFMSMRNPEIYRDYYGVGALFNSIAKNFGRNWKVTNYFAKAIAVASTRGWDAAKEDLRNEFWKLSFGSMRYLLESEQNSGGFAAGLIGDQRKGIPGILTGEPDEGGDKQFSYDIANTETWENVKSRFDAVTSGDLDSAKIYRTNQFQSFLNASQLGGVIKGTLQTVRGLGFENLNKLIGDIGVFDVATPYDMGQLYELIDATNVGHTMLTEGTYRPKTAKEVRALIDEVIYRGEHRPGNKSFNKDVFNFENYGHMGGTDYTKDYDLDMEQLLMNMKYERNGDFSFKVDKDGNKIVTQDWKDYMYALKDHANDEEYLINANYQHVFNWVESNRNDPNYMLYQSLIGEGIANKFLEDEADKYIDSYNKAYGLKKSQKLTATELKDSIWYDEVVPYLMTTNMSINGQHSNFIDGLMDLSRPATEAAQMKMIINELKEKGNEDISKFFKVSEDGDIKMSKKFSNYILEQGKLSNYIDEGDLDSFITETASITNMYQKEDPYGIMTTTLLSARVNRINQANNLTAEQKAKAINTLFASNYEFIQKHIPEMIDELGYDAAKTYIDAMNTSLYDISKIGTQLTKENEANNSSSGRGSSASTVKLVNNTLSKIANTAEKAGITPANTNYKFDLVPVKISGSELLKKTGGKGHSVDNVGVYVVKYTPHSRFEIDKDVSRRVKKTSTQSVSTKKQLSNIEAKTEKALTAEA